MTPRLAVAKEVAPLVAKLTLCSRSCPSDLLVSIKDKNPSVQVTHEPLDVSQLHDVRRFTTKHEATQFDWIVLTPGLLSMNGRTETKEGLDVNMCTHYNGRCVFQVHAGSRYAGQTESPSVRVLNVLGAVQGSPPDLNDLNLKRTFSIKRCAEATTMYSYVAFAERAPDASFIHATPGFAMDEFTTGWHLINQDAQEMPKTIYHTDELKDVVWKHALETIDGVMTQH
ncbi:hypothetical protein PHYSODRAFT_335312 [Phytophthora sojae]|uniref:NAD(P)-binding domain-containing protein n=1 Tax=Phytophthora sojae (strain P6497) TaxID=1094619 RepID=G4ZUT1_PHYSP|nr:hypothetical protein PHYSODRAFT_335312 [Phytophthora sojae]EGZ13555.1 hypothetical protein PHYSODRAFT_335312 [Phytophthora sojae]|eukprot:XP_009530984.1 hypothetical protein PHYSODRAFT_335312 [Phytophthora sojae]